MSCPTPVFPSAALRLFILLALIFPTQALAAEDEEASGGFFPEFSMLEQVVGQKMLALAKAIPEESYDWRPMEGVRSVGDALIHAVTSNFFAGQLGGVELPGELAGKQGYGAIAVALKDVSGKEEILALVESSFSVLQQAAGNLAAADLDAPFDQGGRTVTLRLAILGHLEHHGEHLGQLIAYARMLEIVPPWSR